MKFEPIVQYLAEQMPELIPGKTLFINSMPLEANGVLLKDSFSGTEIDGYMPIRRGRFIAAVRGVDYADTKAMADAVIAALEVSNVLWEGMDVKQIRPLNEPIPYQNSAGNRVEFSVSFSAIYGIVVE